MFLWLACFGLSLLSVILLIRLVWLKHCLKQIDTQLEERLTGDTNNPLFLSSRDRDLRRLAKELNRQLSVLRRQHQQYLLGDRELKETIANVSHDLRTPLAVIWGYLELLEREVLSPDGQQYLSLIQNRALAMRQLTEEFFRYSMAISPEKLPQPEPICLNHFLEESLAQFYPALTQRGIAPKISIPENVIWRQAPRASLFRVMENLLSNALKYSDGDLEVSLSSAGEITVSNHAAKLDPVQAGRLFDRFFSVEHAQASTGLGLAIAKTLTEQMGGRLDASYRNQRLTISLRL